MKKTAADLAREQLAASMVTNKTVTPRPEQPREKAEPVKTQPKKDKPAPIGKGYKSALFSLYDEDVKKVNEIVKFMVNRDRKVNASHAVRLALRSVALTDSLLDYDDEIRAQDGRRKAL